MWRQLRKGEEKQPMGMKKPDSVSPQLVRRALVLVLALLVVIGLGLGAILAVQHTSASSTLRSTPTPLQNDDTVDFAKISDTPTPGSIKSDVTLAEYSITSSVKTFHAGAHYYFVVSNRGHEVHEFLIVPDKPDGTPLPMDVQYTHKLIEIEQVGPGTTLYINFVFPPSAVGKYEIACQMRGHYQAGMHLSIVVTR
jgi:uncharacterized cupredoxin-like copper-binding protein